MIATGNTGPGPGLGCQCGGTSGDGGTTLTKQSPLHTLVSTSGEGEGGYWLLAAAAGWAGVEYRQIKLLVVNMKEKKKEVRRGREGPTLESTQVRAGPCQDCGQLGVGIWKGRQSKSVVWPGRFAKISQSRRKLLLEPSPG